MKMNYRLIVTFNGQEPCKFLYHSARDAAKAFAAYMEYEYIDHIIPHLEMWILDDEGNNKVAISIYDPEGVKAIA